MVQRGLSRFRPTEANERKVQKHETKLSVTNFLECVKITTVGLNSIDQSAPLVIVFKTYLIPVRIEIQKNKYHNIR